MSSSPSFTSNRQVRWVALLATLVTLFAVLLALSLARRSRGPASNQQRMQVAPPKRTTSTPVPKWTTLTDKLGYFSVEVVGMPITQEKEHDDGRTTRRLSSYQYLEGNRDEETLVLVAIYGTPPADWKPVPDEERFVNLANTVLATPDRQIISSNSISFGQFLGKEHRIREPNDRITIMRTYLVDDDTLVLSAGFMNEAEVSDDVSRFFNSLQWLKPQPIH